MSSLRSRDTVRTPTRGEAARGRVTAPRPTPTPEQIRALLVVAFRPAALALLVIATCVLVTLVASNSELNGTSGAVAASWLAVNQVGLTVSGASLGVLPLLPTLLMIWAGAKACAGAISADSPRHERWWVLGAALSGPLLVTAIALAVVQDASAVIPLASPNALVAFAWVLAVHLVAAVIGMGTRLWRPLTAQLPVPAWVWAAGPPALRAAATLLASGAALTAVALIASWDTVGELIAAGDGLVGGLGLTVLSILYLPNVVVGATAMLLGSAFHVGTASVGVLEVTGGQVPALPVLGALPAGGGGGAAVALLTVPAAIGVLLGRDCARGAASPLEAVQRALAAAAAAALGLGGLAVAAGGDLGTFGTVGVNAVFVGAAFGWLAVFGAATAALVRSRERRVAARPATPAAKAPAPVPALPTAVTAVTATSAKSSATVIDAEMVGEPDSPPSVAAESAASGGEVVEAVVVEPEVVAGEVLEGEVIEVAQATEPDLPDGARPGSD
ncbi:DUF6350 family protein [Rhodococcus kronopolitis]|uniref:DUF6350 family protein n=1 Tax=Rhodococcus kronopolitis TaxID=1460226 RepID=A0ABV9FMS8_9NOCA